MGVCGTHCCKEDVRNETLEDQITAVVLGNVHWMYTNNVLKNIYYFITKDYDIIM